MAEPVESNSESRLADGARLLKSIYGDMEDLGCQLRSSARNGPVRRSIRWLDESGSQQRPRRTCEISGGKEESLTALAGTREQQLSAAGLDPRTFALVKIAAMIALDAPPASYAREIGDAVQDLVTPEDLLGVLRAVAPQVGGPRVVAAAPEPDARARLLAAGEDGLRRHAMPLVRRRRPLLRAVKIACGAYSAGKRRRQGRRIAASTRLDPGPSQPTHERRRTVPPEWLNDPYRPDALNGASHTERNRK